jgi:membrane protein
MTRGLGRFAWNWGPAVVLAAATVVLLRGGPAGRALKPAQPIGAGRGSGAASPADIPARGWRDILDRTRKEFAEDQIALIAAGMTFYTLLALFPGLGALVALYGLFADVGQMQQHLHILAFLLPPSALTLIGDEMVRLAASKGQGLSAAFVIALLAAIWSTNGAVNALMTGLNIAYEARESRGLIRRLLISLGFTLGLLTFGLAALVMLAAGPVIQTFAGAHAATVFGWASWPVLLAGLTAALALLYRYGSSRGPVRWRWITWGSGAAIVVWVAVSEVFSVYVGNFAHYDRTYGPLGAVIGFMTWTWLSSMVVLAGAELNAEIERQAGV